MGNSLKGEHDMSTTQTDLATETRIAGDVLARLEAAWNTGDGHAFGAPYAEDATFVNIRGDHLRGRGVIAGGHAAIFGSIYAGSTNRMELLDARRVADDVIVMTSRNTLEAPHGPLAGVHAAVSTSVLVRTGDVWQIAVTHNTLEATR
jgi:uncharacterized protein (TIGR02246 family)